MLKSSTISEFPFSTNDKIVSTLSLQLRALLTECMPFFGKFLDFDSKEAKALGSNSETSTFLWIFTVFLSVPPLKDQYLKLNSSGYHS